MLRAPRTTGSNPGRRFLTSSDRASPVAASRRPVSGDRPLTHSASATALIALATIVVIEGRWPPAVRLSGNSDRKGVRVRPSASTRRIGGIPFRIMGTPLHYREEKQEARQTLAAVGNPAFSRLAPVYCAGDALSRLSARQAGLPVTWPDNP